MLIASEQRAKDIAANHAGAEVFWYEHRPSRLTLFGVSLPCGRTIIHDPRAAVPRKQNGD